MDTFYWIVGYVFTHLLWIIPAAIVGALLINGLLVSISLLVWEIKIIRKNNKPMPSIWKILKITFFRIFTESFTDSHVSVSGAGGKWTYLWGHTVHKVVDYKVNVSASDENVSS